MRYGTAYKFIEDLTASGVPRSAIGTNDFEGCGFARVYITIPYGSKRNGGKWKRYTTKFGKRALGYALKFWDTRNNTNEVTQ
jgi:hypothetical protein